MQLTSTRSFALLAFLLVKKVNAVPVLPFLPDVVLRVVWVVVVDDELDVVDVEAASSNVRGHLKIKEECGN